MAKDGTPFCRVCKARYIPQPVTQWTPPDYDVFAWLEEWWCKVDLPDVEAHRASLMAAARPITEDRGAFEIPPLDALLKLLSTTKAYIHFITFGITAEFLGALRMVAAAGSQVAGLILNAPDYLVENLSKNTHESINMTLVAYPQSQSWTKPHQKLIVVDGIIAITGSANLTLTAWRKVESDDEMVSVVRDEGEVIRVHNRYFSPAWAKYGTNRVMHTGPEMPMSFI